jgi:hypothetical protein
MLMVYMEPPLLGRLAAYPAYPSLFLEDSFVLSLRDTVGTPEV